MTTAPPPTTKATTKSSSSSTTTTKVTTNNGASGSGLSNGFVAPTLPKTIEGATERYMRSYETQYRGVPGEKIRLKSYADARIFRLKTKAPKFYEEKLPTLINQAASNLLTFDTTNPIGLRKFHEAHAHFLRVLDELKKSQPAGEVDFQNELDRTKEKDELKKKHLKLRDKVDRMEATEFDVALLGEEGCESAYAKLFAELDRDKVELKRIATLIVKMEGELPEDDIKFQLKVVERSTLDRLSREQLNKLESIIESFYIENKRNKKAMYVDKSVIDGMIAQLDIDTSKFTQVEMNQLSKDALDAYKTFFRNIANQNRNDYHETLINNRHLRPKEGIILESPDDIPEVVRQKLNESELYSQRKLNNCVEEYAAIHCNEDVGYDEINDEEGGASDDDDTDNIYIAKNNWLFNRVKEEPRDDYENDAPSEDEVIVDDRVARELEATLGMPAQQASTADKEPEKETSEASDGESSSHEKPPTEDEPNQKRPKREGDPDGDRDFEVLGVVEPTDKITCITIDDD